jgi:hypothetical protein
MLSFGCNRLGMRPMLVNTRQKIAVLASGLAIATTGFVTEAPAPVDPPSTSQEAAAPQPSDEPSLRVIT